MADQQSRGGKKQGHHDPSHPDQQMHTGAAQRSLESSKPSDQGRKPVDEPRDNPSEAPESGDKKVSGNA